MKFITPEELINNINCKKDAEKIYNKLFIMQEEDKNCNQFVRFKIRDDATLVCMEIKK